LQSFKSFEESLYHVNDQSFEEIALKLFHFQAKRNAVYAEYIRHLGVQTTSVRSIHEIPYLPVSFFKTHDINPAEFLSLVWRNEKNDAAIIDWVASRSAAAKAAA